MTTTAHDAATAVQYAQPHLLILELNETYYRISLMQGEELLEVPAIKSRVQTRNFVRLFCTDKFAESNVNGKRVSQRMSIRDLDTIRKWIKANDN